MFQLALMAVALTVKVGDPAPPIDFDAVWNGAVEDLRGKALVLEFWATW